MSLETLASNKQKLQDFTYRRNFLLPSFFSSFTQFQKINKGFSAEISLSILLCVFEGMAVEPA